MNTDWENGDGILGRILRRKVQGEEKVSDAVGGPVGVCPAGYKLIGTKALRSRCLLCNCLLILLPCPSLTDCFNSSSYIHTVKPQGIIFHGGYGMVSTALESRVLSLNQPLQVLWGCGCICMISCCFVSLIVLTALLHKCIRAIILNGCIICDGEALKKYSVVWKASSIDRYSKTAAQVVVQQIHSTIFMT